MPTVTAVLETAVERIAASVSTTMSSDKSGWVAAVGGANRKRAKT
jgi:hypothetical protein